MGIHHERSPSGGHQISDDNGHTGYGATRTEAEEALKKAQEYDVETYQPGFSPYSIISGPFIGPKVVRDKDK